MTLPASPIPSSSFVQTLTDWLSEFQWDDWGTLTTARAWTRAGVIAQFLRYVRQMERVTGNRVCWFWVMEDKAYLTGIAHPHLQVLLSGTINVPRKVKEQVWGVGLAKIQAYDRKRGGVGYCLKGLKHLEQHQDDYDISKRLPPRIQLGDERWHPWLVGGAHRGEDL